jgi:hypothetical protein
MDEFPSSAPPIDQAPSGGGADLARHFLDCGRLNTNLSLAPGRRLVITDDFLDGTVGDPTALAVAAIIAPDNQVARAAIIPLAAAAHEAGRADRQRYERLFRLIEETAFDQTVRDSADMLLAARFREAEIRDLAEELGGAVGPARQRYRDFLDVVKRLVGGDISQAAFLDEFVEFTRAVAGKLDFGIYAMCVDRLFVSPTVPFVIKPMLLREVLRYPPLIRKEILSNLLSSAEAPTELVRFARGALGGILSHDQIREVFLFAALKLAWQARTAGYEFSGQERIDPAFG